MVAISYSLANEELHRHLARYKREAGPSAERSKLLLGDVLERFITRHETCLAEQAKVRRFQLVTAVPSGDRLRDERHPLRSILTDLVPQARERHERLLRRSLLAVKPRQFDPHRFTCVRPLEGASILLVDDTWTTGASARSAGAALKQAGAGAVAVIVIGRYVNREWRDNARLLERLRGRFDWNTCGICDHGPLSAAA